MNTLDKNIKVIYRLSITTTVIVTASAISIGSIAAYYLLTYASEISEISQIPVQINNIIDTIIEKMDNISNKIENLEQNLEKITNQKN